MSDDVEDFVTTTATGGLNKVFDAATEVDTPKAAPKAPAPVTAEDPNVKQAAASKRRRLQSSRQAARVLSPSQASTTLG